MKLPMYVVNAFCEGRFSGNPAAVVLLPTAMPEQTMQAIASQNNLAETAFVTLDSQPYGLRWFTPSVEVDLCGHATLAAAVALTEASLGEDILSFTTASGVVSVASIDGLWQLNFPARPSLACDLSPERVAEALGCAKDDILAIEKAKVLLVELSEEACVAHLRPDMTLLNRLDEFAVMVTARARQVDFVVRFFAPNMGIEEDPVTGSAYTTLAPYWHSRLDRQAFTARQLSSRGGYIECQSAGDRVLISGKCEIFLTGNCLL